jgi:hypothetical protein
MGSLADLPELVGFFSYSREDDVDSHGALSALRTRIQGELRGQLGRTAKAFRLWQDKEAIPSGTMWESEIKNAVWQAAFFIPIITPTVVASPYCRFEIESFLAREAALGRDDLVFPILYIEIPALEDAARRQNDPVLSLIARRQYVDWSEFRYLDVNSTEVRRAVGRFCADIRNALQRPWVSPEERWQQQEAAARELAEAEEQRREAEARRRTEDEAKQRKAEEDRQQREADAERQRLAAREAKANQEEVRRQHQTELEQQRAQVERRKADEQRLREEAEAKRRAEADERRRLARSQAPFWWPPSRPMLAAGSLLGVALLGAIGVWLTESSTSAPVATAAPPQATPAPAVPAPSHPAPPPAPASVAPTPAPTPTAPVTPAPVTPPPAALIPIPGLRVAFGDTIDKVRAVYNITGDTKTDCSGSSPCFMLEVPAEGLTFFFNHDSKILYEIRADAPYAGNIAGARIGDAIHDVVTRFGQPTLHTSKNDYTFVVGRLVVYCRVDDAGNVVTIFGFGQK